MTGTLDYDKRTSKKLGKLMKTKIPALDYKSIFDEIKDGSIFESMCGDGRNAEVMLKANPKKITMIDYSIETVKNIQLNQKIET